MKTIKWSVPAIADFKLKKNNLDIAELETFTIEQPSVSEQGLSIPFIEDAESPKEELIYLLKIAAEVEHALMVQYLYAAYSITDDDQTGLKRTIINIAIQEMGHFLAVQNLLLSIGGIGSLHLDKNQFRPTSVNNPLPFKLEQVSKNLLAKFVAIEAPIEPPENLRAEVENIRQIAEATAGISLNPVGGLYMKIFWLFQADDTPRNDLIPITVGGAFKSLWHVRDEDFLSVTDIQKFEADFDSWDTSGSASAHELTIMQVHSREDVLNLVYRISAQGEGANFDDDIETHFELFYNAYHQYDTAPPTLMNLPMNPVTRPNPEFGTSVQVSSSYSLLWNDLFNKVYTSLLYDIYSSFFYKQFSAEASTAYVGLMLSCMRVVINTLAKVLVTLQLLSRSSKV